MNSTCFFVHVRLTHFLCIHHFLCISLIFLLLLLFFIEFRAWCSQANTFFFRLCIVLLSNERTSFVWQLSKKKMLIFARCSKSNERIQINRQTLSHTHDPAIIIRKWINEDFFFISNIIYNNKRYKSGEIKFWNGNTHFTDDNNNNNKTYGILLTEFKRKRRSYKIKINATSNGTLSETVCLIYALSFLLFVARFMRHLKTTKIEFVRWFFFLSRLKVDCWTASNRW